MKFLVIRFSSIGDIVFTTPVIRCLKQQLPNSTVHFLTKKNFKAVTEHNPYIDKFFFIDEKDVVSFSDLPPTHADGFVAIVIGASYFTKKLPVYKLQELVKKINDPVILMGGKEDEAEGDEIASADPVKVYNTCGKFRL